MYRRCCCCSFSFKLHIAPISLVNLHIRQAIKFCSRSRILEQPGKWRKTCVRYPPRRSSWQNEPLVPHRTWLMGQPQQPGLKIYTQSEVLKKKTEHASAIPGLMCRITKHRSSAKAARSESSGKIRKKKRGHNMINPMNCSSQLVICQCFR